MRTLRRLVLPLALAALAVPATAQAASSYCSPSGDVCYSAVKRAGVVRLALGTFSFRGTVDVCVTPPGSARTCKPFRLRERRGISAIDARWSAHFPRRGAGTYRVTFASRQAGGVAFTPAVTFRLRA